MQFRRGREYTCRIIPKGAGGESDLISVSTMMKSETEWVPITGCDHAAVEDQLGRILSHHLFKSSHRCQCLLRYIVEHSLRENSE